MGSARRARAHATVWVVTILTASSCGTSSSPPAAIDAGSDAGFDAAVGAFDAGSSGAADAGGSGATDAGTCIVPAPTSALEVATDRGAVRGVMDGLARVFRGIPFAAPPVGELRWREPVVHDCWEGVRPARTWGNDCAQVDPSGARVGSEDCLTLNVWAPLDPPATPRPVLVYLHGGDNIIGSGHDSDYYDGRYLIERANVVLVTVNYRLGAFGFLKHPSLADADGASGNYGLMDQIAALQWVQRNAAAFGGDPTHVMLYGQSAGADDTCALVSSPRTRGLFTSALTHSSSCSTSEDTTVAATAESTARALRCDTAPDVAACMRAAPTTAVATVPGGSLFAGFVPNVDFYVTVDGKILTETPLESIRAGRHNHVPLIWGVTRDEYLSLMSLVVPEPMDTDAQYQAAIRAASPKGADFILEHYPSSDYASPRLAWVQILNDSIYFCPMRQMARASAASQTEPVRRYIFATALEDSRSDYRGAGHGVDVMFAFHAFAPFTHTAAEDAMSDLMIDMWARFAATGDPGPAGSVAWPEYDPVADTALWLDADRVRVEGGYRAAICDIVDAK